MRLKITNSLRGKISYYAQQLKQRMQPLVNTVKPIYDWWLAWPLELREWLRYLMMAVLIAACLVIISGCSTKHVAIQPPSLLLGDRSCAGKPQTYREALQQLESCKTANAGHQNDKAAIKRYYEGLK